MKKIKTKLPGFIYNPLSFVYFFIRLFYWRLFLYHVIIRKNTSDYKVFKQIFLYREYDINYPLNPKLIIDAGANTGFSTLFFAKKFPNAVIYAVEPEKSNYITLVHNTKKYKNIKCINKGLWNKNAFLKIENPNDNKWSFFLKEVDNKEDADVEVITVDEILKDSGLKKIDIFKVDIEGAEKELFSSNYKGWVSSLRMLIIELHDEKNKGCSETVSNVMQNYSYKHCAFGENWIFECDNNI